jgi:hypothetical protein
MLTRRRLLICLLIATLLIVPIGGWVVWRALYVPEPVRAYERLRLGMTREEVTQAIGMPQGNYGSRDLPLGMIASTSVNREAGLSQADLGRRWTEVILEVWTWDEYWIAVAFDFNGTAVGHYLYDCTYAPPSLLDRLRQFIGL